jgi:hypothetical protein
MCKENYGVQVNMYLDNSSGIPLYSCTAGYSTNYAQCQIWQTTSAGDFWTWTAYIDIGGTGYGIGCSNQNESYETCFG